MTECPIRCRWLRIEKNSSMTKGLRQPPTQRGLRPGGMTDAVPREMTTSRSQEFYRPDSFNCPARDGFWSSRIGGWDSLELAHHGGEDFVDSNRGCRALIVAPFVKELLEQW